MEWIRWAFSLAGVIGLILFMFWMLRKVQKQTAIASGSKLRIIDRANTGRDSSLLVVSVGGKLMLVGVSTGTMVKLCDLDLSEEEYFGSEEQGDKPSYTFAEALSSVIFKKRNLTGISPQTEGEEPTVESDNKTSDEG
jgi:flagellar protein FliO/FliZ